jgi:hypothetical protein
MRPNAVAQRILSTTRATAKLHEFRVPEGDFFDLPHDPAILFSLAIGILGDVAATIADEMRDGVASGALGQLPKPPSWDDHDLDPVTGLRFASTFFDAFLNAKLNGSITTEFSLLCAAAYYLSGNVGSATVIVRRMELPALDLCGGLGRLVNRILANDFQPIPDAHAHAEMTSTVLRSLHGYINFEIDHVSVFEACAKLRASLYRSGSPRELFYGDLTAAICFKKLQNASRTLLPIASELSEDMWRPALQKAHFPIELWPAQQRIAAAGLLQGQSAVIQMPTSAGKTRDRVDYPISVSVEASITSGYSCALSFALP